MTKKNENRQKADRLWIGILVGLLVPVIMSLVFVSTNNFDIADFWRVMKFLSRDSMLMAKFAMVCLLPNTLLAFLSYKLWLWDTYKGVMLVTLFLLVPAMFFLV